MKRTVYIMYAMLISVFASCSQNEMVEISPAKAVTLKVSTDESALTRTPVYRYVIEVYSDNTYTTAANVFGSGATATNRTTNAIGEFSMTLDRTKAYYCLIWADKAGSDIYDVRSLKAVTLESGETPTEAWHGTFTIAAGTSATLSATLKRAVSKITLLETGTILANSSLAIEFKQPSKFDVSTATASELSPRNETIDLTGGIAATSSSPATLKTLYVLSSKATADVTDLTFIMSTSGVAEASFAITNVPLQANYNTNIKGHYTSLRSSTFVVTYNNTWADTDY